MTTVLLFLIVLVVLIVVHELGHFLVAKATKMRVDEFGVGFPPKVFGIKRGETEYTVNALPFGGFVRIFGEDKAAVASDDPDIERAFFSRPKISQALVLVAGVAANILLAWVLFSGTLIAGVPAAETPENAAMLSNTKLTIVSVIPNSPAEEAGIRAGDAVVSVAGEPVAEAEGFSGALSERAAPVPVTFERGGTVYSVTIAPETGVIEDNPDQRAIGVSLSRIGELSLPIHLALWEGFVKTATMLAAVTVGILGFLFDTITLQADLSQIAGPVGIAGLVGEAAEFGFIALLSFTAFISLNLAIINLLPFPALDGGRLLFLAIEAVRGKALPSRFAQYANMVGFLLLIFLMVVVTFSDIARLTG